jgi:hypothetical protein
LKKKEEKNTDFKSERNSPSETLTLDSVEKGEGPTWLLSPLATPLWCGREEARHRAG